MIVADIKAGSANLQLKVKKEQRIFRSYLLPFTEAYRVGKHSDSLSIH